MTAIMALGVIESRWLWDFDLTIEGFGIHDFSLVGGLLVDGIG
jgi:hypothetical protein